VDEYGVDCVRADRGIGAVCRAPSMVLAHNRYSCSTSKVYKCMSASNSDHVERHSDILVNHNGVHNCSSTGYV
jgi:hypothetical protein